MRLTFSNNAATEPPLRPFTLLENVPIFVRSGESSHTKNSIRNASSKSPRGDFPIGPGRDLPRVHSSWGVNTSTI